MQKFLQLTSVEASAMSQLFATPARSFTRVYPQFKKENANKINKIPLQDYLEELMRRRPANASGYINLP
jgi:hypothetical protein